MLKIRSIILDIDGTLTESRNTERLSTKAIEAIRKLLDTNKTIEVGLATGNSHIVAMTLARYIGLDLSRSPIISENGCILWYKGTRYELCAEYKELLDLSRELIVKNLSDYVRESYQNEYRKFDYAYYVKPGHSPETVIELMNNLLKQNGLEEKLKVVYSGYAIHILPKDVDKGSAVKLYSKVSGIPIEEIAAVGDSDTDIPLLEAAGIRVAVSNATENLKKIANIILSKPSGEGVAEFIEKFVLV